MPETPGKDLPRPKSLAGLPLELRHKIYDHAAHRAYSPNLIIKNLLELTDPNEDTSQLGAAFPAPSALSSPASASSAAYNGRPSADHVGESEGDNESDEDDSQSEEHSEEDDVSDDEEMTEVEEDQMEAEDEEEGDEEGAQDEVESEGSSEDDEEEQTNTATAQAAPPARPAPPFIGRCTKYRHMLPVFQINHHPPRTNLLLMNQALNAEVEEFFYATLTLTVDATKGFAHTTFFEETLSYLISAHKRPLQRIRNLKLHFVWDSEFLDSCAAESPPPLDVGVMASVLGVRVQECARLLSYISMPALKKCEVLWEDSIPTTNDAILAALNAQYCDEIYCNAEGVPVNVNLQQKYGSPGQAWPRDSRMGQMRKELRDLRIGRQGLR